ncbi:hypothetical protein [Paenibacillus sp. MMS18-CY102]|uniref:hypothetical protein n=1 Tax=Paenibacillus sp. MMS18-CY102 TaxID=2682849 RepID=UPI001365FAF4|nr:hypothetical protein [Paenibacillus sp. MMS18-CY102]MWC30577.1 hypothetical protein [Paenibacillus sp. MMS18-CY102]
MSWNSFVNELERNVDWNDKSYRDSRAVEQILYEFGRQPEIIRERCETILLNNELLEEYEPHMNYPRITMDKFMLYMHPEDLFRIRIHRFKHKKLNGETTAKVHSHKWLYSTLILKGAYRDKSYRILNVNEQEKKAELSLVGDRVLSEGDTYSGMLDIAHQTINESVDEHCLTLFIRGKAMFPNARIYQPESGTFYPTYGARQQLRVGLEHISRLQVDFH